MRKKYLYVKFHILIIVNRKTYAYMFQKNKFLVKLDPFVKYIYIQINELTKLLNVHLKKNHMYLIKYKPLGQPHLPPHMNHCWI